MDERIVAATVAGIGLTVLVSVPVALRWRRERRDRQALAENAALGLDVPASIHPVIDTDRCIGSLSCLKACPEGDILGIIDGAARLVHASNCLGHGRCAAACPVNAITLVSGTAIRGIDLPEVDGRYESNRLGVHLIGGLAGVGLFQNAVEQGVQCAGFLAEAMPRRSGRDASRADVVVIGASPAGVSCAVTLRGMGHSVRLLDQGPLGGAVAGTLRLGASLSGTLELPGAGSLRGRWLGREAVLAWLSRAIGAAGLRVEEGVAVTGLSGEDGAFTVATDGDPVEARKVVLATGPGGASGHELLPGFLGRMGIEMRQGTSAAGRPVAPGRRQPTPLTADEERERRRGRRWLALAGGVALLLMAGLWWVGRGYYPLGVGARFGSRLHSSLKPAGSLGLTVGIAATAVMLTNFAYAVRKRWRRLAGVGHLGSWLDLHVFVGIMSPIFIAFHAAFQSNNHLATGTYWALAVVVATGLVGRYLYGLVPRAADTSVELADLLGQVERLKDRLQPILAEGALAAPLPELFAEAVAMPSRAPFLAQLLVSLPGAVAFRLRLSAGLRRLPAGERVALRDGLLGLHRLKIQAGLFGGIRRLMRVWRSVHVALAILLVMALALHVGVAVYLGYGPRLR
jgi:NAD-dependent dihydropyrimidine dehydrogenase PreA subunit